MRDRDIRLALHEQLEATHLNDETLIVHELGLCQGTVRADVAVVNGSLAAFEIKSDQDTLDRLPRQVEIYGRVFDYVTLIVGKRHARGVAKKIPPFWGITIASETDGALSLKSRRTPKRNKKVDPVSVARLLWRDEALALLAKHHLAEGLRSKPRRALWDALAGDLPQDDLSQAVRETLRARRDWPADPPQLRCGDSLRSSAKS